MRSYTGTWFFYYNEHIRKHIKQVYDESKSIKNLITLETAQRKQLDTPIFKPCLDIYRIIFFDIATRFSIASTTYLLRIETAKRFKRLF